MQGVGFAAGFTMVILSGSALFTEINVTIPRFLLKHWRYTLRPTLIFWITVWVGNICGALFCATLINIAGVFRGPPSVELEHIMQFKMYLYTSTGPNATSAQLCQAWFQVLVSGILGNWLVGMVAFFAAQSRTVMSKILGVFFPVLTFTALGVQHSTANMGTFFNGLIYDGMYGFPEPLGFGWGDVFAYNLIPASIGNIIGGIFLVVLLFSFAFHTRDPKKHSFWFPEPIKMRCAVCDALEEKETGIRAPPPTEEEEREHPMYHITLAEGYGDTVAADTEILTESAFVPASRQNSVMRRPGRENSVHSPRVDDNDAIEMRPPAAASHSVPVRINLAQYAREVGEQQVMQQEFDEFKVVL